MIISQSTYNGLVNRAAQSVQNAQDAYDRLDQVLGENERLLKLLEDERGRNQDMAACVIDTLREALGMEQTKETPLTYTTTQAGNGTITYSTPSIWAGALPEMPKVIEEAIQSTFPDDAVIQEANRKYAYSQESRWDSYAKEIADEIRQGA